MNDSLHNQFLAAAEASKSLPKRPDNDTMLRLYALFKQGNEGDISGQRPGVFDFVAGAKYDAWEKLKGQTQEQAQEDYVKLVTRLQDS